MADERINQLVEKVERLENFIDGQQTMPGMAGNQDRLMFRNKADLVGEHMRTGVNLIDRLDEIERMLRFLADRQLTNRAETLHWIGW